MGLQLRLPDPTLLPSHPVQSPVLLHSRHQGLNQEGKTSPSRARAPDHTQPRPQRSALRPMPRATPAHPGLLSLPCAVPESTSPPWAQTPASSVHLAFTAHILEPERPSSAQPMPTAQPVCPAAPVPMPPGLSFPVTPPSYPLPASHSFIRSQSTEGLLCMGHQASLGRPVCRADSQPPSSLHSPPHLTLPHPLVFLPSLY